MGTHIPTQKDAHLDTDRRTNTRRTDRQRQTVSQSDRQTGESSGLRRRRLAAVAQPCTPQPLPPPFHRQRKSRSATQRSSGS
eukprot:3102371-Rhodomonas_salina.1